MTIPTSDLIPQESKRQQDETESNGWERLLPLLDPRVVQAATDPMIWQRIDVELVSYLATKVSAYPWLDHLALAGMVYATSGAVNQALPIYCVNRFLRWAIPTHYPDIRLLDPEAALATYFGDKVDARGWSATKGYNTLQLHMQGYRDFWSSATQEALAPFFLPTLVYSPRLKQFNKMAVDTAMTGRKEQSFAVIQRLPELVALARKRYKWIADLEMRVQQAKTLVISGAATLPVTLTVPGLAGKDEVIFRLWDQASWAKAHPNDYRHYLKKVQENSLKPDGRDDLRPARSTYFLQLVGDLPEHAWFLRAIALSVLQGTVLHSPSIEEYLKTWKLPAFGRRRHAGLLTPGPVMGTVLRYARRTRSEQDNPPVLFCVEPLLTASAVGLLALTSIVSTGMRVGELMQVALDRECMTYDALPKYTDQSQKWIPGPKQIYWLLYPKGRQKRERYLVSPAMYEALFILLDLHARYHGRGVQPIRPVHKRSFKPSRHFQGKHRFVFQWDGKHIHLGQINQCIAFLLLEHPCRNEDGKPVNITSHVLRHGIAGWLHQQGVPLEEIMVLLKHVSITVTQYYSKLPPEDLHAKLGPALSALAKLAGEDSQAVRTVGDIQELAQNALKRYGALRHTPGGMCAVFTPCEVQFKCATCTHFVPDPARRDEVQEKVSSHSKAIQLFLEEGDFLQADVQREQQRAWQRVLKEIDALKEVELISPPTESVLGRIGANDLGEVLLHDLNKLGNLALKGKSQDV